MGPRIRRKVILVTVTVFIIIAITYFTLERYSLVSRSKTVLLSSYSMCSNNSLGPELEEDYVKSIKECELCEHELIHLKAVLSSSQNGSPSNTDCQNRSDVPSLNSSKNTPIIALNSRSTAPLTYSSPVSSLWEDPELQSMLAAFRAVVPQNFLNGYKNPCWYVDYQIIDSISEIVNITERHRWNENAVPHKSVVQSVIRGMYDSVPPGTKKLVCLPYFMLLGFIKCGTTTLHDIIAHHPDFAQPVSKEIFWWTKIHWVREFPTNVVHVMRYLYHFLPAAEVIATQPSKKFTGDSSPTYIHESPFFKDFYTSVSREDIERIPCIYSVLFPKTKYLVIFREPADRTRSDFYFFTNLYCPHLMPVVNKDIFHQVIVNRITAFKQCMTEIGDDLRCMYLYRKWVKQDYDCYKYELRIDATLYYLSVQLWLKYFQREQFLFLRNEDLAADRIQVAKQVYDFLELDPVNDSVLVEKLRSQEKLNHGPTTIETEMRNDTKELLRTFFAPYNTKLAELLNDDKFLWNDIP